VADSPVEEKPKKKAFMDDDDEDITARAAAIQKAENERIKHEANESVRKAAEEDGKFYMSPGISRSFMFSAD
jgi:hypothetical protein